MLSRRKMLRMLASLPAVGGLAGMGLVTKVSGAKLERPTYKRDFFTELGLRPFINARGTITTLSASLMLPEVMEAINYAAQQYVNLYEMQDRVGERIAEMLHCEAAMVTAGAASALTLGAAAAVTGTDQDKIQKLPNLPGPQPEILIQKSHRYGYDRAVINSGAKLVEVRNPRHMERSINENTVLALFFNAADKHDVTHEEFIAIGKRHGVPTFNDAAADVPPVENLFKYQKMGFDLVTFSGGKAIRGPQSAGLLFGRKDLIEAAKLNNSPHGRSLGRGMKVNKEEMLGMLVALESYLERDHEKEWQEWEGRVQSIASRVSAVPSVETERYVPEVANHVPHLRIRWDQDRVRISPREVLEELRNGYPSIEAGGGRESLTISVFMMQPEEVGIVGRRVREVLEGAA